MKRNNKRTIRITEGDITRLVKESVNILLNEMDGAMPTDPTAPTDPSMGNDEEMCEQKIYEMFDRFGEQCQFEKTEDEDEGGPAFVILGTTHYSYGKAPYEGGSKEYETVVSYDYIASEMNRKLPGCEKQYAVPMRVVYQNFMQHEESELFNLFKKVAYELADEKAGEMFDDEMESMW